MSQQPTNDTDVEHLKKLSIVKTQPRDLCQTKLFACPIGNLAFKQRVIERREPLQICTQATYQVCERRTAKLSNLLALLSLFISGAFLPPLLPPGTELTGGGPAGPGLSTTGAAFILLEDFFALWDIAATVKFSFINEMNVMFELMLIRFLRSARFNDLTLIAWMIGFGR